MAEPVCTSLGNYNNGHVVLNTVRLGFVPEFLSKTLSFFIRCPVSKGTSKGGLMETAIHHLLAIQPVPQDQKGQGFYSILFMVPKSLRGWRAILDPKYLNRPIIYKRFKMQSLQTILESIREGDFLTSIDLMVPILPDHRQCL